MKVACKHESTSTLIGGPLCGRVLTRRSDPFLWIVMLRDAHRSLRASSKPTRGVLYRRLGDGAYLYAAWTHRRCEACQGIEAGTGLCSFCGGNLLPA